MLVYTKKEVIKYLLKDRVERLYLLEGYDDKEIFDLVDQINEGKNEDDKLEIIYLNKEKIDKKTDNDENQGIVADVPDKAIVTFIILIISAVLLFFIVFGISFSLFETNIKGVEVTKNIILNYSDVNGNGNGIKLVNASAISDNIGMVLKETGSYFDFTISGNTYNVPLNYLIVLDKESVSTLDSSKVKVYLSSLNGNSEIKLMEPILFSDIATQKIENKNYKLLYTKNLDSSVSEFSDTYRFRMWVDENADQYYNQTFSVKINVFGEGTGE